jgi:hypothetical protein
MNQDLAQQLTNVDALINSIKVDPGKSNNPQMDDIRRLRTELETKIKTYNDTIARANEDVRKDVDGIVRQIQQRVNYLNQPPQ